MKTPLEIERRNDDDDGDDEDIKIVLTSPESSTLTQLLDPSGNKIGEVELNTYDNFSYATESFSTTIDRIVWGEEDTNLLLEKYELYISQVGPRKRFQSKKNMWNQIASDIYLKYKLILTGTQCENRFKTISKRKKQSVETNLKQNNSKVSTTEEERCSTAEESLESEGVRQGGLQTNLEKLEQSNQELSQQIEQNNIRFATIIEKIEKHHNRQQQKLERSIQETKEQIKIEFTMLLEKLDKIHTTIQQNQEQQQQTFEKLIKENHEEHKTEFNTLIDVLQKINNSIKYNSHFIKRSEDHICTTKPEKEIEIRRSRSHSKSRRRGSRGSSPHTPHRKRRCSSVTRSPSTSKCHHKSPTPSHTSKHSKSGDRHSSGSLSSKGRNNQHNHRFSHAVRSKHNGIHKSKSRSPKRSLHRCCIDSSCKQHDKYR